MGEASRTGWKVRRKEQSALRFLTVKDIFEMLNDPVENAEKVHAPVRIGRPLLLKVICLGI